MLQQIGSAADTAFMNGEVFKNLQMHFIQYISHSFNAMEAVGHSLFYVLAGLEFALFGLAWAIRQDESMGVFMIKLLKLGLFFMLITQFRVIMQWIINGFTVMGFTVGGQRTAIYFFSPDKLWSFAAKTGVSMMKLSAQYGSYNTAMSTIYLILGLGILVLFTLIIAQVILSVVLFYLLSVFALFILPLGLVKVLQDYFAQMMQLIFKAGARVFGVIVVLGIGQVTWSTMNVKVISETTSLGKPLALFLITLVILVLMIRIPALLSEAIGKFGGDIFSGMSSTAAPAAVHVSAGGASPVHMAGGAAAAMMSGSAGMGASSGAGLSVATNVVTAGSGAAGGSVSSASNVPTNITVNPSGFASTAQSASKSSSMSDASGVNKRMSDSSFRSEKKETGVTKALKDD